MLEGHTRVQSGKKVATVVSGQSRTVNGCRAAAVVSLSHPMKEMWSSFRRECAEIEAGAAGMGSAPGNFRPLAVPVSKTAGVPIRLESAYFGAFDAFLCFSVLPDEFYRMALDALILGLFHRFRVEPAVGIEPTTGGLQNRCSTAELCWPTRGTRILDGTPDSANGFATPTRQSLCVDIGTTPTELELSPSGPCCAFPSSVSLLSSTGCSG